MAQLTSQMKIKGIAKILPAIRIHSWGGLGSQLFTLVIATRIREILPYRRVKIVFHTSGVTFRSLEIPVEFLSDFSVQTIDDFKLKVDVGSFNDTNVVKNSLLSLIKLVLQKLRFLISLNSDEEFIDLKWWTIQLRGHYSHLHLEGAETLLIYKIFQSQNSREFEPFPGLAIHFRLGDLKHLVDKSFISANSVLSLLSIYPNSHPIRVFSDSTKAEVLEVWPFLNFYSDVQVFSLNPFETAMQCILAKDFIGTSAKLSIWIAVIRIYLQTGSKTLLPISLGATMDKILKKFYNKHSLRLY